MAEDSSPIPSTVPVRLIHWANQEPQRYANIFRSPSIGRMTLARVEVKEMSFAFAARLARAGIRTGDVVCNTLQNSPERVVTDLGMMSLGAVLVDMRVFHRDLHDLVHTLNRSKARCIIVDPGENSDDDFPSAWKAISSNCSSIGKMDELTGCVTVTWPDAKHVELVMFCPRGETGKEFEFLKSLDTSPQIVSAMEARARESVQGCSLAALFQTSGSTGKAKLSAYTQSAVLDCADNWQNLFQLSNNDVLFQDRPMGWVAAFHQAYLSIGLTRVLTDGRTQPPESCPETVWTAIVKEGVTFAHLTPFMVSKLLSLPDLLGRYKVKLRHLLMTGQPLKKDIVEKTIDKLADTVHNSYGMTETSYLTSVNVTSVEQFEDFCVGYPHTGAEVHVVNEDMQCVERGVMGQVLVRCRGQFKGYYGQEDKTRNAYLSDGWLRTDDLGFLDSQGKLYNRGRRSDAIMRGVVVVYPYSIEKGLWAIPGVKDAMVVAVPDPELYHEICACLILAPGSTCNGVKAHCNNVKEHWKNELLIPKYFLAFDHFPVNANGKVTRFLLQQAACKRLGLQA